MSYGITLSDSDHYRETESPRLRPRDSDSPPQTQTSKAVPVATETGDDDEFGSFSGATDLAADVAPQKEQKQPESIPHAAVIGAVRPDAVNWSTTRLRPHTASAAFSQQSKKTTPPDPGRVHTVQTAFKPPVEVDQDEFGDFETVEPTCFETKDATR